MSAKGYNLTWVEFDDDAFDDDEPMSCYRAWTCLQNAQHLLDSSGQYRVHTAARLGDAILGHTNALSVPSWAAWQFPLTMMYREHPPNFDVRVAARISGGCTAARVFATLLGFNDEQNNNGAASPQALYYKTTTTTATTSTWVIDEQYTWAQPDRKYMRMRRPFTVSENGSTATVDVVLVRLEIGIEGTYTSAGVCGITGVQLREYA